MRQCGPAELVEEGKQTNLEMMGHSGHTLRKPGALVDTLLCEQTKGHV